MARRKLCLLFCHPEEQSLRRRSKYDQYREAWFLLREASGTREEDQSQADVIPTCRKGGETWGIPDETSPRKQSLNGAPDPNGIRDVGGTPLSGAAIRRMQNAFSFFRKQLERDAPEK